MMRFLIFGIYIYRFNSASCHRVNIKIEKHFVQTVQMLVIPVTKELLTGKYKMYNIMVLSVSRKNRSTTIRQRMDLVSC